ncbi:hypothetical protein N0V90_012524 [Kalmusia sp. IMI 367209]|nr:hypothetical protein N0V90_012524 [Kalmusia sp. IMI 367209]
MKRTFNDAFGERSPHWNLPFPCGNLTAAEIIAYCPHWLKSVDVVDRFITSGAKSNIIAAMINEFRLRDGNINNNSVCVMMQYAMRRAGFTNWTVLTHHGNMETIDLNVTNFRTPLITHPKISRNRITENIEADPIEFRSLARYVKQHPSGYDALDLTRCVSYAIAHPNESWLFPVDFGRLVNEKLGGPQTITHFHLDQQAFERRINNVAVTSASRTKLATTPKKTRGPTYKGNSMGNTRCSDTFKQKRGFYTFITPQKREKEEIDTTTSIALDSHGSILSIDGRRRSGRVAALGTKSLREPDSDTGTPYKDDDIEGPPKKKRRHSDASSAGSEFVGSDLSDIDSIANFKDNVSDDLFMAEPKRPIRASVQKGRHILKKIVENETPKLNKSLKPSLPIPRMHKLKQTANDVLVDPALLGLARSWGVHPHHRLRNATGSFARAPRYRHQ